MCKASYVRNSAFRVWNLGPGPARPALSKAKASPSPPTARAGPGLGPGHAFRPVQNPEITHRRADGQKSDPYIISPPLRDFAAAENAAAVITPPPLLDYAAADPWPFYIFLKFHNKTKKKLFFTEKTCVKKRALKKTVDAR